MASRVLAAAAALVTLAACAAPAAEPAEPPPTMACGERGAMVEKLASAFAEHQVAIGLAHSGGVLEIFASASGSWTMLLTWPEGGSCLLGTGDSWDTPPPAGGTGL